MTTEDLTEFGQHLRLYYQKLFPFSRFHDWLSYGRVDKAYFSKREFSFTLKGDVYLRFKSFDTSEEFAKEMSKILPHKIDIGAVYNAKPKTKKALQAGAFLPMERELVFDIDMTDYDDVRYCCSGALICQKCWPLMNVAIKTCERALREDFGFQNILWVYSGRRGVHAWVCDERARKLTQEYRSAVADYLTLVKGGDQQAQKVSLGGSEHLHPSIQRALGIAKEYFPKIMLQNQDILGTPERWNKVLAMLDDEETKTKIDNFWTQNPNGTSTTRWIQLEKTIQKLIPKKPFLRHRLDEIILSHVYPRLDVNVSKGLNHLLKSPFCVHPKTGRVCVPIDAAKCDDFDPFSVATVNNLIEDINEYDLDNAADDEARSIHAHNKTRLKDSIALFDKFLEPIQEAARKEKARLQDQEDARAAEW